MAGKKPSSAVALMNVRKKQREEAVPRLPPVGGEQEAGDEGDGKDPGAASKAMGEEESDSDDDAEGEEEDAREQAAVPKKIVAETARPILIDPKSVQLRRDVKVEAEVEAMFLGEGYLDMVSSTPPKNWGNFNNRHVQEAHVKALLRCFEETGIAFWEHTISIKPHPELRMPEANGSEHGSEAISPPKLWKRVIFFASSYSPR
ncbi:uncharacterized protein TRAVEDRAFT_47263 [Trametes versicolor FP-101664 SS1]|uniref:uncharacterized protein n=1 Tax=Trametes versicolor (strain FP-101664) TaxID=717944 RepID=UPI0004622F14|nr:uncharacterized protein TRAVEDRAFT_47263 [Trametes versicolor FP-101664 SS1]EIW59967.1 hypothetical protein TRAVEDRAFT_47263 [Trametes versicolor FP-101664 SS1]